uniref:Cytochrome P450 n=1 Tax=Centaurium erythraea TaxID=172057 RepID=Q6PLI7_CENER|nr:cytochrome P450 [Centaurium erythraea]
MEITDFSTFLLAFLLLSYLLVTGRRLISKKSTGKLPPGPKKFPIVGNLPQLALAGTLPHRAMRDLAKTYGPLMHLRLGEVSQLVVSSPEMAKEVLKTLDPMFASRPDLILADIMLYDNAGLTFAKYGDYWRQLKKIFATELLSAKRVKSFRSLREEETLNTIRWISSNEGKPINMTNTLLNLVFGVLSRATFGKKSPEQDKLVYIVNKAAELATGGNISDLFPSIKFFRLISVVNYKLKSMFAESNRLLDMIMKEHKKGNGSGESKDLVDVLLGYQRENAEFSLTDENIKAVLLDIFIGGTDGSFTTLDWAMSELMRAPTVLKRAQEEVRQAFETDGYIDEEKFEDLKYVTSIIKETLRLHPPAPLLVPRSNDETAHILGYEVPAKSKILVNVWAINRDPRYWEDAESFKPERFLGSSVGYKGTDFHFLTFGAGRRMCPGMVYGYANIVHPLVKLLYYFDWNLPSGIKPEELDMTEEHGLSVKRKADLYLIPSVRNSISHL